MINGATQLLNRLDEIVGIPSISSASDDLDMSNSPVIDYLAERFADLGFSCEIIACSQPGKVNLIATKGTGPGAGARRAHRYRAS